MPAPYKPISVISRRPPVGPYQVVTVSVSPGDYVSLLLPSTIETDEQVLAEATRVLNSIHPKEV